MSESGPGCVETLTSQECAELFSLSSRLSSGRKHFWFSNLQNRDGISTRRLNVPTSSQGGLFGFNSKIFAYESDPPVRRRSNLEI